MKYFKSILFSMFVILVSLTVCGCEYVEKAVDTYDSTQLKVTMIYPSDCVGSAAYCTSFHIGLMSAVSDLGILLTEVNADENDQVSTEVLMREAANNSDLVITAGYQMGDILNRVAPDFPDVNFSIFDVVIDQPNVAAVNYKSNEGSFLVGAIAALKSTSGKIGYIGGADVPLLHEFEAGYIAGIREINPLAEISVEYISTDATGFDQPAKAKEIH